MNLPIYQPLEKRIKQAWLDELKAEYLQRKGLSEFPKVKLDSSKEVPKGIKSPQLPGNSRSRPGLYRTAEEEHEAHKLKCARIRESLRKRKEAGLPHGGGRKRKESIFGKAV